MAARAAAGTSPPPTRCRADPHHPTSPPTPTHTPPACHPSRYDDNGGTVVAVAGDDYCIVAASTRMSTGYSILTREKTKILQL